jgi:hypothetical protein
MSTSAFARLSAPGAQPGAGGGKPEVPADGAGLADPITKAYITVLASLVPPAHASM